MLQTISSVAIYYYYTVFLITFYKNHLYKNMTHEAEKCPKFKNVLRLRTYPRLRKDEELLFWILYKNHGNNLFLG